MLHNTPCTHIYDTWSFCLKHFGLFAHDSPGCSRLSRSGWHLGLHFWDATPATMYPVILSSWYRIIILLLLLLIILSRPHYLILVWPLHPHYLLSEHSCSQKDLIVCELMHKLTIVNHPELSLRVEGLHLEFLIATASGIWILNSELLQKFNNLVVLTTVINVSPCAGFTVESWEENLAV